MINREGTTEFLLFHCNPSSSYENTASALGNLRKLKINCWLQRQKEWILVRGVFIVILISFSKQENSFTQWRIMFLRSHSKLISHCFLSVLKKVSTMQILFYISINSELILSRFKILRLTIQNFQDFNYLNVFCFSLVKK